MSRWNEFVRSVAMGAASSVIVMLWTIGQATAADPAALPADGPLLLAQLGGGLLQGGAPADGGGQVFTGQPAKPAERKPAEARPAAPGAAPATKAAEAQDKGNAAHKALYGENQFPSAVQCGECHPKQFREWSVSQHAYAEVSVVFHAMQHSVNVLMNGSNGDFCARCHSAAAGALSESPDSAVLERHAISREGITCISCHRVSKLYNKVSGRIELIPGDISKPVYGPTDNKELKRVLKDPQYHVEADPTKVGRHIHADVVTFEPIRSSTFCGQCHDVTLFNGFRLEEAFAEYRTSPAAADGITCQDCHMGRVQGKVSGYEYGPAAVIDGVPTKDRRITNHLFSGPDYPIVHPGLFPFNKHAQELANVNEWTQFDYKAGWGTDAFEKNLPPDTKFPDHWASVDDRYDAAALIKEQFKLLEYHKEKRLEVLRSGFAIGKVESSGSSRGIEVSVEVKSLTGGHNVPTGFTAERAIWLDVTVTDPSGKVVYRSGDRDPNGDLRDSHSEWVRAGKVPLDSHLFNLQTEPMVRNLRGTEQPAVLPIPFPLTALTYIRPSTFSQILLGRPTGARNQKHSIEPFGHRVGSYSVDGDALTAKGTYTVSVKLMSQAVPVNLVLASQYVGFDYNMSPKQVVDKVVEGAVAFDERTFTINIQ
jgi:Cytochrome c554 and c-prime